MPTVSGGPKELNALLEKVYASALKQYKGDKGKASATAWSAAKEAGWKKDKEGKWMKPEKKKEMSEIVVDAFKEGTYPQGNFGPKELSEIASTYDPSNYEAPALIGHISDPAYKGKTTIPAFGWIGKIKQVGDHLKFVFSQFSDELKEFIEKGYFKKVSAAFFEPTDVNNPTPGKWHLHHLAFLGAVPPQVKGLEDIAFAEFSIPVGQGIAFAEMETTMEQQDSEENLGNVDVDPVEKIGTEDTITDLEECCATFVQKIEASLTEDIDYDTSKQRCSLAAFDLQTEIQNILELHWDFQEKLENIEEHQEQEYSETQRGKLKSLIVRVAERFNHKPQESDMDAQKQAAYEKTIADQKKQLQEFADQKAVADKAVADAADVALKAQIASFCETNKLNTNKFKEMHVEEMFFAAAKANQTIEFATKDKDGKETKENKPLLTVLQDTLKTFLTAMPQTGELTQFNQPLKGENKTGSPKVEMAEEYVKEHPEQFSEQKTMVQKKAKALQMEAAKQITFKSKE